MNPRRRRIARQRRAKRLAEYLDDVRTYRVMARIHPAFQGEYPKFASWNRRKRVMYELICRQYASVWISRPGISARVAMS